MKIVNLTVDSTRLICNQALRLVQGSQNYYNFTFSFDSEWDGLIKTVVFAGGKLDTPISVIIPPLSNSITLPNEIANTTGIYSMGVLGIEGNVLKIPTNQLEFWVLEGTSDGTIPKPTDGVYQQIISIMQDQYKDATAATNAQLAAELARDNCTESQRLTKEYETKAKISENNAKAEADRAVIQSTSAKAEADRASAISASIKHDEGYSYANQLIKMQSEIVVNCDDMHILRDVSFQGATNQKGIPSPNAPIPLQCATNPKLTCSGKNLFSPNNVKLIASINTLTDADYIYLPKGKYIISHAKTVNLDRFGFILRKNGVVVTEETAGSFRHLKMYSQGTEKLSGYFNAASKYYLTGLDTAWEYMTIEVLSDCEVGFLRLNTANTEWENVQLETTADIINTPSKHTSYRGNSYIYNVNLGKWDVLHVDNTIRSAWIERGARTLILDGSEDWSVSAGVLASLYECPLENAISGQFNDSMCSHFIYKEKSITDLIDGEYQIHNKKVRFKTNHTTLQEFKAYLTTQQAANAAVTIKYKQTMPTIEELIYNEVIAQRGISNITNSAGTNTTIQYGQDINIAFAKLQNAILSLGGNI